MCAELDLRELEQGKCGWGRRAVVERVLGAAAEKSGRACDGVGKEGVGLLDWRSGCV